MRIDLRSVLVAGLLSLHLATPGLKCPAAPANKVASLEGTITDPDGGAVPNAFVTLYARDLAGRRMTTTGLDGTYVFPAIPPGEYLLQIRAEGFAGFTTQEIGLAAGAIVRRDIQLELARLREEVIVTASSTPLMIEEVSKATDIVSREEIALRDEYSVSETLRLIPGFRVQQLQGPGSLTSVSVRGLRSHDTALLVDGLRMRDAADPQGSVNPLWEDLLVVSPEQAEVLRGSGSSLYGTHAIGGVVNVVTDQGGGSPHGEVLAEGGGLGMMRGLAKVAGGVHGNRLVYAAGLSHVNVTRGLDGVNPYRNTSGQGSAKYFLTPSVTVSGRALVGDTYKRLPDSPYLPEEMEGNLPASGVVPGVPLPDEQVHRIEQGLPFEPGSATYVPSLNDGDYNRAASFQNFAAIFTHQWTPGFSWRASYQFLDTNRRFSDGPAGVRFEPPVNSHSTFDGRLHLGQVRADAQAGRYQLITGGYEFEHEEYDTRNWDEESDPMFRTDNRLTIRQLSHSVFAQDQINLLDRNLQIAVSGRMQAFRPREPEFRGGESPYAGVSVPNPDSAWTGDGSLAYLLRGSGTKLRVHVGNSYRAPSAFERYGATFFFGSFSPFGDPRLSPERALSFDAGFDQWLAGSRVKLSGTWFYTRLQEIIVFDFSGLIPPDDPFGRSGGYLNVPGGLARGVELSVNANPSSSTVLNASYTYSNSDMREPWDSEGLVRRSMVISDHMFSLLASQWIGRRFNITLDLFAVSGYLTPLFTSTGTRAYEIDRFAKADLTARYVIPLSDKTSLELYGKAENFFNQKLYENGYRAPGIWGLGGLRLVF